MSRYNQNFHRIDKLMYNPAEVPQWVVLIYERRNRFRDDVARKTIADLVKACEAVGTVVKASSTTISYTESLVGITINQEPALVRWESGQADISRVRHLATYLTHS